MTRIPNSHEERWLTFGPAVPEDAVRGRVRDHPDGDRVLVAFNFSSKAATVTLGDGPYAGTWRDAWTADRGPRAGASMLPGLGLARAPRRLRPACWLGRWSPGLTVSALGSEPVTPMGRWLVTNEARVLDRVLDLGITYVYTARG